jgi:hypothetical protein
MGDALSKKYLEYIIPLVVVLVFGARCQLTTTVFVPCVLSFNRVYTLQAVALMIVTVAGVEEVCSSYVQWKSCDYFLYYLLLFDLF